MLEIFSQKRFSYVIASFSLIVLSPWGYAQGYQDSIDQFKGNIQKASKVVSMLDKSIRIIHPASITTTEVKYNDGDNTNTLEESNPIDTVTYGWITDSASTTDPNWVAAGTDNHGMLGMEVTFKSLSDDNNVHPALAGKTVLFLAYAGKETPTHIYLSGTNTTGGTGNLADPEAMASISGWSCQIKAKRCEETATGTHPQKTCTNLEDIAAGAPGTYSLGTSDDTSLFTYTQGPEYGLFSNCANTSAIANTMASS